jgi:pimeloyl-ACP methyl ester carboxylesterase
VGQCGERFGKFDPNVSYHGHGKGIDIGDQNLSSSFSSFTSRTMPYERDDQGRTYIRHPNGQLTHYIRDSFVDPWKPHETILIQHGFGRHAEFWYHWIPILSRQFHVIRRDLRGHGHSTYPQKDEKYEYNVDTIVGEIVDTLDQLGVTKCHFLGESTGGMLGEIMAAKLVHVIAHL